MFIENEVNLTNTDKYFIPEFYSFLFLFLLLTPYGVADMSQPSLLAPALFVGSSEALLVPKKQTDCVVFIFMQFQETKIILSLVLIFSQMIMN